MTPYIPLLPRRRPYRPPRHTVPTEPFDVPRLGAKVAGAETRSMVDLALVEDEENEGAGWDDVAGKSSLNHGIHEQQPRRPASGSSGADGQRHLA